MSNSSSKSLKYLLGNSPKSYRESKYEGEPAQHSQLHENENVANELNRLLMEKIKQLLVFWAKKLVILELLKIIYCLRVSIKCLSRNIFNLCLQQI